MKSLAKMAFPLLVSHLIISVSTAQSYPTSTSIWTLAGSEAQARLDSLLPLANGPDYLIFSDLQAKYGSDDAGHVSLGAGYRKFFSNWIFGSYFFVDYNDFQQRSPCTVLSPGIETLFPIWDFRVNGYFPINARKRGPSFFPSGVNTCGEHGDCSFVVFKGHQQFEHQFFFFEEVGPGFDAEVGLTLHHLNNAHLDLGGYHYNLQYTDNINGIEARAEIPINNAWAIALEANYDHQMHATVVAGVRFNLGQISINQNSFDMRNRIYSAIPRNLGSLHTGASIPLVTGTKDEGLFLRRDNIYFFSAKNGFKFDGTTKSGTLEHPLAANQLTQTVVDEIDLIAPNANLYFNTGTFTIQPGPNSHLSLPDGQSIFGRSVDYKCTVTNNERPILLGGLDLFLGNNTIDSIQLINTNVGVSSQLITLDVENAENIHLCNDLIKASTVVVGDNFGDNSAISLYANNSDIVINKSILSANAQVRGINAFLNQAAGIGGISFGGTANFTGNNITILNSIVSGFANVTENNNIANFASGIGGNTPDGFVNVTNNEFIIQNSVISGTALVNGDNNLENFATGIGGNYGNFLTTGDASFENNRLTIIKSSVSGKALVDGTNNVSISSVLGSMPFTTGDNISGFNFATGIGGNVRDFTNNAIYLSNSDITGAGIIDGTNGLENYATGFGGNFGNFFNNSITIKNSNINSNTSVTVNDGFNYVTAFGGNAGFGTASFIDNDIVIFASSINCNSVVEINNLEELAVGIGGNFADFRSNSMTISDSSVKTNLLVTELNNGTNLVTGLGGNVTTGGTAIFSDNDINIRNSSIAVNSTSFINSLLASNIATGVRMNNDGLAITGNKVNIFNSGLSILAQIDTTNAGTNSATGLIAEGAGDVINIFDSIVKTFALVGPGSTGTNTAVATSASGGGVITSVNTVFVTVP